MPQTLGDPPAPPQNDVDLSAGVVKKKATGTKSDVLDLSAGLVPRTSKAPGKKIPESTGTWDKIWTGIMTPETGTKVATLGIPGVITDPNVFGKQAEKARAAGHPAAAAFDDLQGYTASFYKATGDTISSLTSPGNLGLMAATAGGSEAEQAGMKVLSMALKAPGRSAGLWFGAQGLKIAATPQQPGESQYDAFWRRNLGLAAFMGTAHSELTSAKGAFKNFLTKQFKLNDDLAGKVSSQVQSIDTIRKQTAGNVAQIDAKTGAQIKALQDSLQDQLKDVQQSSSTRISAIRGQAEQAIQEGKGKITDLQAQRLRTGANTVADTMQAFLQEKARVSKPFDDIAGKIKGSVAQQADVRGLIEKSFKDNGVDVSQIPPRALELLKTEAEGGARSGSIEMRGPDGQVQSVPEEFIKTFTNKGFQPIGSITPEGGIPFDRLTRIREDIGQAANAAKDTSVKRALFKASDDVTDLQESIADKHKLGKEYRTAKDNYRQFARGIGSDMVHTFLDASDAEAQALAPKIADLTTKQNAEALRTVLKAAGVDVKPLDAVISDIKTVDDQIGETERLAGTITSEQEKSSRAAKAGIRSDIGKEIASTRKEGTEQVAAATGEAESKIKGIKKDEVIPGQDVESLKGKSNRELLEARIRQQMNNGHTGGFVNTWAITSIVFGLMETARGSMYGPLLVGKGTMLLELPRMMKERAVQDWVIRQSGMDPGSPQATRVRKGLVALGPVLQKALKSGVPQAAAVGAANDLGQTPTPPSR